MKITGQIEGIFAHAVALDQNGNLKNSIYVEKKEVLILNYDHTVALRFRLRESETPFEQPISFKANDYDSNEFYEEDGKIVFTSVEGGYARKKVCGKAEYEPSEVRKMIKKYSRKESGESLTLNANVISLLDESLSHIEFSGKKGESLKMIQRNIYSGGIIEVTEDGQGLFQNNLKDDFGPVGIKTKDFISLFTFQDSLKFEFPVMDSEDYIKVSSLDKKKRDMTGIIACCLYDELIEIQEARHGGEE